MIPAIHTPKCRAPQACFLFFVFFFATTRLFLYQNWNSISCFIPGKFIWEMEKLVSIGICMILHISRKYRKIIILHRRPTCVSPTIRQISSIYFCLNYAQFHDFFFSFSQIDENSCNFLVSFDIKTPDTAHPLRSWITSKFANRVFIHRHYLFSGWNYKVCQRITFSNFGGHSVKKIIRMLWNIFQGPFQWFPTKCGRIHFRSGHRWRK